MAGSKGTSSFVGLPEGAERIERWARSKKLPYQPHPDPAWFEAWEPYDTMTSPEAHYSAVSLPLGGSAIATLVEPWYAPVDQQPLDRTLLAFVSHPGLVRHVAARGGQHFNTRVAYLETPPPPQVQVGDTVWDSHMVTYAASPAEAEAGLPLAARRILADWGFVGHLEIRPGGGVVNHIRMKPTPEHYQLLASELARLVAALVSR